MPVTPSDLRRAIAEVLWERVGANELPAVCVALGLGPGGRDESSQNKRAFVKARIAGWKLPALVDLARAVVDEHGSSTARASSTRSSQTSVPAASTGSCGT